ncbi:MAG: alpha/beta hydrolase-fold protein [Gammaproteobacteria bacterium]|nr:alpha/beta hydrolase-fold protein [Gammaproteobacteria bacterium]
MIQLGNSRPMDGLFQCEYYDIQSTANNTDYRIFVAKPSGASSSGQRYPVVYSLDGNLNFASVMQTHRAMALGGEVPQSIIVGVGYSSDDPLDALVMRQRDYTFSSGGEVERIVSRMVDPSPSPQLGGAPAFLEFLTNELKPALSRQYPVADGDSTLVGVSLGGLFGGWTLLSAPEAFRNFVLCSPSFWWNQEEIWSVEQILASSSTDLPASVFLSAGALETAEGSRSQLMAMSENLEGDMRRGVDAMIDAYDQFGWPRMSEITTEFAHRLRARKYPSLRIHCHNMPDETHTSVGPGAIARGFRFLAKSWVP